MWTIRRNGSAPDFHGFSLATRLQRTVKMCQNFARTRVWINRNNQQVPKTPTSKAVLPPGSALFLS
jgi:hypothetical protein